MAFEERENIWALLYCQIFSYLVTCIILLYLGFRLWKYFIFFFFAYPILGHSTQFSLNHSVHSYNVFYKYQVNLFAGYFIITKFNTQFSQLSQKASIKWRNLKNSPLYLNPDLRTFSTGTSCLDTELGLPVYDAVVWYVGEFPGGQKTWRVSSCYPQLLSLDVKADDPYRYLGLDWGLDQSAGELLLWKFHQKNHTLLNSIHQVHML